MEKPYGVSTTELLGSGLQKGVIIGLFGNILLDIVVFLFKPDITKPFTALNTTSLNISV